MKKTILILLLIPSLSFAGNYVITTTSEQDIILQKASSFYDKTIEEMISSYKDDAIMGIESKIAREKKRLIMQKYDNLTEQEKSQIESVINK